MQEQNSFALSYATPLRHFSQPSPHNRPSSTCCKWRSAWCDHHRRPESLLESEPDAWVATSGRRVQRAHLLAMLLPSADGVNSGRPNVQRRHLRDWLCKYQNRGSFGLRENPREGMMAPASFDGPKSDDLREFFELSLNLWCIAGTDGYFKHLNPAWETTFGYTREELLARPYSEFVHPDDREATIAEAAHVAMGRSTLSFENRYRCKDGTYKWLLWSAIARPERELIYGIAANVTDRKREEARLAAQYAVTRVLAEAPTLASATPRILQAICNSLGWSVGAIWRVDQKEQVLRCVETWHKPAAQAQDFDERTHSVTFSPNV